MPSLSVDSEYGRTMFSPLVDVFGDQEVIRLFSEESLVAAWLEVERALAEGLATLAEEHRRTVMPGRTHAQPAVPIAFGGKVAVWLSELAGHLERLRSARAQLAVVQLFGAAGTAAALGPRSREVRHAVAARLGLRAVDVPWHTARDGVAAAGFAVAALAGVCGRIGRE